MDKYEFVKDGFSCTMDSKCIANHYIHCEMIQGNYYIRGEINDLRLEEGMPKELMDGTIPNVLKKEDLHIMEENVQPRMEKEPHEGHVHHIDENRMNNHPDNLMLLCINCHTKMHCEEKND